MRNILSQIKTKYQAKMGSIIDLKECEKMSDNDIELEQKYFDEYHQGLVHKAFRSMKDTTPSFRPVPNMHEFHMKRNVFYYLKDMTEQIRQNSEIAAEMFYQERIRKLFDELNQRRLWKKCMRRMTDKAQQHYNFRLLKIGMYAFRKHLIQCIFITQTRQRLEN